jgi:NhaP-type Na+/H+ or K+/H+ antiporter
MLVTGMGLSALGLIHPTILAMSTDLREIALIVILLRAGLAIDLKDLKAVGRPAILMCFIPATFEMIVVTLMAPILFGISYTEAAIMGAVLGAVSPAVIIPRMLQIRSEGYGKKKSLPQLIMAGSSVDDIYLIVLFTIFMSVEKGGGFSAWQLVAIPASVATGILVGVAVGAILHLAFKRFQIRDTVKLLIIFSVAFLLVAMESAFKDLLLGTDLFSGLLAVMALGVTLLKWNPSLASRLSHKFSKVWIVAEILLFVLVGAAIKFDFSITQALSAVLLIVVALFIGRFTGVLLSLIHTSFNKKEKLFCMIAYVPKATVQAAIGAIPLAQGVPKGNTILMVAVIAILVTAPLGDILIRMTYKRLL